MKNILSAIYALIMLLLASGCAIHNPDKLYFLSKGQVFYNAREYKKAKVIYNKLAELKPDCMQIFKNRMLCSFYLRQFEDVINDYDIILKSENETESEFYDFAAFSFEMLKKSDKPLDEKIYRFYNRNSYFLEGYKIDRTFYSERNKYCPNDVLAQYFEYILNFQSCSNDSAKQVLKKAKACNHEAAKKYYHFCMGLYYSICSSRNLNCPFFDVIYPASACPLSEERYALILHDQKEAVKYFDTALANNQGITDSYFYRAYAEAITGKFDDAIKDFGKSAEMITKGMQLFTYDVPPYPEESLYYEAKLLDRTGKKEEAVKLYVSVYNSRYHRDEIIYKLSWIKTETGLSEKYSTFLDSVIKSESMNEDTETSKPDTVFIYLNDTDIILPNIKPSDLKIATSDKIMHENTSEYGFYLNPDDFIDEWPYSKTLAFYDSLLTIYPAYPELYSARSKLHKQNGKMEMALNDLNSLVSIKHDAEAYNERAKLFERMHKPEEAEADYNMLVSLEPTATSYRERGSFFEITGKNAEALQDFNKAIELDSLDEFLYLWRANFYKYTGSYKEALLDYNHIITKKPDNEYFYVARAKFYFLTDDSAKAMYDLRKAIEIKPYQHEAYEVRAEFYKSKNKLHEALADYYTALNISGYTWFNYDIMDIEAELGNYKNALIYAQKILMERPESIYIFKDKAFFKEMIFEYYSAITDYTIYILSYPDSEDAYFHRGLCRIQINDIKCGMEDIQKAAELCSEEAEEYLKVMQE